MESEQWMRDTYTGRWQ